MIAAADGVVRGARGGVPGIEVPAQHHHFVRLVGAGNLGDGVVAGLALRIDVVDDVELHLHVVAVGQQALHAAEIVIAEDDRGNGLGGIVGAILLGHDHAFAARRVVHSHHRAARDQHGVDLLGYLRCGQPLRIGRSAPAPEAESAAPGVRVGGIVLHLHERVVAALGWRIEVHRNHRGLPDQHDLSPDLIAIRRHPLLDLLLQGSRTHRPAVLRLPPALRR